MTALTRFLQRHGLEHKLGSKVATAAAFATFATLVFAAPGQAKSEEISQRSFTPSQDTTIGARGMAERVKILANRIDDRLEDMQRIAVALSTTDQFLGDDAPEFKAKVLVHLNNNLYNDTPNPEMAGADFVKLGLPDNLDPEAAMRMAVDALNERKDALAVMTRSLEAVAAAYSSGDVARSNEAAREFTKLMDDYVPMLDASSTTQFTGIEGMSHDEGWKPLFPTN